MHQEVHRREYKSPLPSQRLSQQRMKFFGHVMRHPDSIEHKVCFNDVGAFRRIRHQNARGKEVFRKAPPRVHWAEQSMVQAHNRIQQLEAGYHPKIFDCDHQYFKTPNRSDCYAQLGPSVKHNWCNNTATLRPVKAYALDRDKWKLLHKNG